MINRRNTVYIQLPDEMTAGKKTKDAKMEISISLVLPKELDNKRAKNFIDDQMDDNAKAFKKFMKKQIEKEMGE